MAQDRDLFNENTELERKLGLPETLSIIINRIIGSGIFRTPAPIMLIVGSVSLFYGVWILGAIVTILGALCYAELVSMMPKSGGPYVFLKAAYPPQVTFLRGWAMFFVSETGAIAAVALFFSETLISLFKNSIVLSPVITIAFVAIFIIWLLSWSNSRGVVLSGSLQNIFGTVKILILLAIVLVSFSSGFNANHFSGNAVTTTFSLATIMGIGEAMRYGFFAYSGWEGATYVAEEIKNPRKNLPLSLFLGISGVMFLYLLINTAYLNLLSPKEIAGAKVIAVDAMKAALGNAGAVMVAIAIMVSTFTNVNAQLFVKSRTWFAMARDGLFFKPLSDIHPTYKTPNISLIVQASWASVLVIVASFAENAYETIIDFFSFTSSVFNILTFASVWVLRRKYPEAPRPYKVWGYPFTLLIVLFVYVFFMINTLITAFVPSMIGIALTLSGLAFYYIRKGK